MKSTGVVRKMDELGRIVIPAELRKQFNINIKDPIEIYTEKNAIILKKYSPPTACVFCGEVDNTTQFKDKYICPDCLEDLYEVDKH